MKNQTDKKLDSDLKRHIKAFNKITTEVSFRLQMISAIHREKEYRARNK